MKKLFLSSVLPLLICGCVSVNLPEQAEPEIREYDLQQIDTVQKLPEGIIVEPFESDSPAKYKMLSRSGVQVKTDEFNRWVQSPAMLLTRRFRNLATEGKSPAYTLRGRILNFELEQSKGTALLCVEYTLVERASGQILMKKILTTEKPVPNTTADGFAAGMTDAVAAQMAEITNEINALNLKAE